MKFAKKSRYGIKALIDLSMNSKENHVPLYSIAERNNISVQYLEQIFASLKRAGLVKSIKGAQGGYQLKRPAEDIRLVDIIEALEGDYHIEAEDLEDQSGYAMSAAMQTMIIDQINAKLDEVLESLSLKDLERETENNQNYNQYMYYI